MVYLTKSAEETKAAGRNLAKVIRPGTVVFLDGEMGAGKTTFSQGFLEEMGVSGRVVSPTFIIMKQYNVDRDGVKAIYHVDLYRITANDLDDLGITSLWGRDDNVFLIEWPSILNVTPPNLIRVKLEETEENYREINVTYENNN